MRVYVGATFSRYIEARAIMDALIEAGHEVTHDWTRTDAFGPDGHPLAETNGGYTLTAEDGRRHAEADVAAIRDAQLLLMLGSEPSCGWPVEVGIGIALGRLTWIVAPFRYTVFWDLPWVATWDAVEEPLRMLGVTLNAVR